MWLEQRVQGGRRADEAQEVLSQIPQGRGGHGEDFGIYAEGPRKPPQAHNSPAASPSAHTLACSHLPSRPAFIPPAHPTFSYLSTDVCMRIGWGAVDCE